MGLVNARLLAVLAEAGLLAGRSGMCWAIG